MSYLSETLGLATDHRRDGRFVIRLVGSFDATNAVRLMEEVTQIYPTVGDRVELNLQDLTLLDSTAMGALVYTEAFVKARGGDLVMRSPSPGVRATLEHAGLERLVACAEDLPSAEAQASCASRLNVVSPRNSFPDDQGVDRRRRHR